MEKGKGKISVKQVMLLFIITGYTPAVRMVAGHSANHAKQAAWLIPSVSLIIYMLLIYVLNSLLRNYRESSYSEIIYDIVGKYLGKLIVSIYLIWLVILLALYVRYYAERLVTSIYANVNIDLFIITMLVLVAFIIRSGIVVIARINEIIFHIISIVLIVLMALLLPGIKIDYLTPISSMDIIPVLTGAVGTTGLLYITYILFFSHEFSRKKEFLKHGVYTGIYFWIIFTLIIVSTIGNIGYDFAGRSTLSFYVVVKRLSVLGVLTGFESLLVATWILTDFILIIVFTYSIMNMIKSLFNLRDYNSFINIFLVILYSLTWLLAYNAFELHAFSNDIAVPMNVIMQIGVPILIFLIAKVRKKI